MGGAAFSAHAGPAAPDAGAGDVAGGEVLRRGRVPRRREIGPVRELASVDLEVLRLPGSGTMTAPQRLRESHHMVARLFASGLRTGEVVARSGYSYQRVWQLESSPAFQELIAKYRNMVDQQFVANADAFMELATSNMIKAERQIADRLDEADEAGETLPVRELISISRDAADRFGYSKKAVNVNVNLDFAAKLEQAIKRSGVQPAGPKLTVIEGRPQPAQAQPPQRPTVPLDASPRPLIRRRI